MLKLAGRIDDKDSYNEILVKYISRIKSLYQPHSPLIIFYA